MFFVFLGGVTLQPPHVSVTKILYYVQQSLPMLLSATQRCTVWLSAYLV